MTEFFTDSGGLFAAIVAVVGFVGLVLGVVRPFLQRRRETTEAAASLEFSEPHLTDVEPWALARELRVNLTNAGGRAAVMQSLELVVVESQPSPTRRHVKPGAPVSVHEHRVELRPGMATYDVRARTFGPALPPLTFAEGETEAFLVKVVSTEPQLYRLLLRCRWYDTKEPNVVRTTETAVLEADYPAKAGDD